MFPQVRPSFPFPCVTGPKYPPTLSVNPWLAFPGPATPSPVLTIPSPVDPSIRGTFFLNGGSGEKAESAPGEREDSDEEDSLGSAPKNPSYEGFFRGKSYMYRNVYKSILRNMFSYFKNNKDEMMRILIEAGFDTNEIEHAFFKITYYNDNERKKGNKKLSQRIIKKVLAKKSIYLYVLRETLNAMLKNQEQGKLGRVTKRNYESYTEVCKACYEESVRILSQPAQSRTYKL